MIKSPFNFVPLANRVFYPDWADMISHDIPFKDGISGSIDMTIEAETPIFVRDGHGKETNAGDSNDAKCFAKTPDGRFFIPSTSVKGSIRNVLEILSFSKMKVDGNSAFAQREWNNATLYPIKSPTEQSRILCGWLVRKNGRYFIRQCKGHPQRINLKRIDEWIGANVLENYFSKEKDFKLDKETTLGGKTYDPKTARFKYALLKEEGISKEDLKGLYFSEDNEYSTEKTTRYYIDESGTMKGTLVFTGQPDKAKNWNGTRSIGDGKFYEFIFEDEIIAEIPLEETTFLNYNFIYQGSSDWEEWMQGIDNDGIPVFFRLEEGKKELKDFGLALLYRLPYVNTPLDIEESRRAMGNKAFRPDMSECIFGYAERDSSLKGRVFFSNFISDDAKEDQNYTLILNSPKASYYPIYIRQDKGSRGITNEYRTYNDGSLAGWKRYYLRDGVWVKNMNNSNVDSTIRPLCKGTSFKGKVTFHNLRPYELGALISAITFHGNDDCRHQIGHAKAYGFGKVKVTIDKQLNFETNSGEELSCEKAMAWFEYALEKNSMFLSKDESIIQLMSMSSLVVAGNDPKYQYMVLDVEKKINEFVEAKGGDNGKSTKFYLEPFTALNNSKSLPKSVLENYREDFDVIEGAARKELEEANIKAVAQREAKDNILNEKQLAVRFKEAAEWKKALNCINKVLALSSEYNSMYSQEDSIDVSDMLVLQEECSAHVTDVRTFDANDSLADVLANSKYPVKGFENWSKNKSGLSDDEIDVIAEFFKTRKSDQKKLIRETKFFKSHKDLANEVTKRLK